MTRNHLIVLAVAVMLAALVWHGVRAAAPRPAIDLVAQLNAADKRPLGASDGLFGVSSLSIAGDTRRAVFVRPPTRITWDLTLPNRGLLRTAIGLDPRSWEAGGAGAQFRIGISVGPKWQPLMVRHLNPSAVAADRGWIPVVIDLSPWSGQRVHVVLATDPWPGGAQGGLAYWAAPAITLH